MVLKNFKCHHCIFTTSTLKISKLGKDSAFEQTWAPFIKGPQYLPKKTVLDRILLKTIHVNAYSFFSSLAFSSAAFLLSERLLRNRLKDSLSDFLKLFLLEMGVSDVPVKSLKTKKPKQSNIATKSSFSVIGKVVKQPTSLTVWI